MANSLWVQKSKSKTSLEINVKGLDETIQKFADWDKVAAQELRTTMEQSLEALRADIEPWIPVGATGTLKRSFGSRIEGVGSNITGHYGSNLSKVKPLVQEFGRKSSMPNSAWLEPWVMKVLGIRGKEVKGVAFAVARSLAKKRRKGRFFLSIGKRKIQPKIIEFFERAVDRIVQRMQS